MMAMRVRAVISLGNKNKGAKMKMSYIVTGDDEPMYIIDGDIGLVDAVCARIRSRRHTNPETGRLLDTSFRSFMVVTDLEQVDKPGDEY